MRTVSLEIENFKAVKKKQVINFEELGKFVLIVGDNGAGKSTIPEALSWVRSGKTSRKLTATSVVNWDNEGQCRVTEHFVKDDKCGYITRTQSPNKLILSYNDTAEVVTQEELDDFTGYNFATYHQAVHICQMEDKFIDLRASEKMQILSSMLDLSKWEEASNRAKDLVDKHTHTKSYLEGKLSGYQLSLDMISFKMIQNRIKDYEERRKLDIEQAILKLDNTKLKIKKLKKQYHTALLHDDKVSKVKSKAVPKNAKLIETLESNIAKCKTTRAPIYTESLVVQQKEKQIIKLIEEYDVTDECPTCGGFVDNKFLRDKRRKLKTDLKEIKLKALTLVDSLRDIQESIDAHKSKLNEAYTERNKLNSATDFKAPQSKADIDALEEWCNRYTDEIYKLENQINPYKAELVKARKDKVNLQKVIKENKEELEDIEYELELHKYWIKGFKDVRLFVAGEVFKEFEFHVNNNLELLGLEGWEITFSIDSETKKGKVKKGFNTLITSPHNAEQVNFLCYSGGQSQKIRIATSMGLIDMINSNLTDPCPLEIWDETTTWMKDDGIEEFVNILDTRAHSRDKQVIVIDHRDLPTYGDFDNVINVKLTDKGSQFEVL